MGKIWEVAEKIIWSRECKQPLSVKYATFWGVMTRGSCKNCCILQPLVTANVAPSLLILFTLIMEVVHFSKTSVFTTATQRYMPEDDIFSHHCENVKSFCDYIILNVRFEVFTAVTMMNGIFWDVTPCGSCKNRRFGGTYKSHTE
jgi:hypothetical protein